MGFSEFKENKRFTAAQERSIRQLEGPLLISAGAGSGKTYTLTQRITWALLPGSGSATGEGTGEEGEGNTAFLESIDQALVITFTEKAAGEIKDRIRGSLRANGMLEEALKVDAAWISTIHGMCSRILREHALEIGMDPNFSVIRETQEQELRHAAIESVLAHLADDSASPYHVLFKTFELKDVSSSLEELMRQAATLPRGLDAIQCAPEGPGFESLARDMLSSLDPPPEGCTSNAIAAHEEAAGLLRAYLESGGDQDKFHEATRVKLTSFGKNPTFKNLVNQARSAETVLPFREHEQLLLQLAREVDAHYQEALTASGQMDMAGLVRRTLAAFHDFPEIAAQYTQRFKLIMVDEFQDTSQLQIDMIECIAGAGRQHLCTVGDAQQSIYRFQGADVAVYLQHKASMQASGASLVQLDANFRSHGSILAFVRRVCGQPGFFQEDFLDLEAKVEGPAYKSSAPRVEVALADYSAPELKVADARKAAAAHIAQRFSELREAGHASGEMVLLIGTTSNAVYYAQALREAGFNCVVAGGSKYFEDPAVLACLDLLEALANPYDAGKLLTVLTSSILPVTTEDLLYLSTNLSDVRPYPVRQSIALPFVGAGAPPKQASDLLTHAMNVFVRAWAKLGAVRPADLFKETILETGWLQRLEAGGVEDAATEANVLKFIHLIEDAQATAGFDMAQTASEMRRLSLGAKERPGALSTEDAVRIMTVHASKGLEFPIVAIADAYEVHKSHLSGRVQTLADKDTLYYSFAGDAASSANLATSLLPQDAKDPVEFRANIFKAAYEKELEERRRLFYVAATRASAALIVSVCATRPKEGYKEVVADILEGIFPGEAEFPAESIQVEYGANEPLQFTRIDVLPSEEEDAAEVASARDFTYPRLSDKAPMVLDAVRARDDFFSYSSLHKEFDEESGDFAEHAEDAEDAEDVGAAAGPRDHNNALRLPAGLIDDDAQDAAQAPQLLADFDKATDFGSALHRACEWLALVQNPSAAEITTALEHAATEFGVHDIARLQDAFARWQTSEARSWALSFDTCQPELPFTIAIDGKFLEGEIDLFCASGKQAGIIDYKTGGSASETPEALQAKHLLQAQCYAFATLSAGFDEVELRFVRVEQPSAANAEQPQTVSYHFAKSDLNSLHQTITRATMD